MRQVRLVRWRGPIGADIPGLVLPVVARLRHPECPGEGLLIGEDRKCAAHGQSDAIDPVSDFGRRKSPTVISTDGRRLAVFFPP